MVVDHWQVGLINWLLTYLLHSTILLSGVWLINGLLSRRLDAVKESLWKVALLGGLFSASAQVCFHAPSYGNEVDLSVFLSSEVGVIDTTASEDRDAGGLAGNDLIPDQAGEGMADRRTSPEDRPAGTATSPGGSGTYWGSLDLIRKGLNTVRHRLFERIASSGTDLLSSVAWIVLFMACGSVLVILMSLAGLRRALRGRKHVHDQRLVRLFETICRRAGVHKRIRLTCDSKLASPLALGILHPEICLPRRAVDSMADAELEGMLAHELAHLVRGDPFWMLLSHSISTIFFFQPLNFIARHRLREIAEYRCDAWAAAQCDNALSLARCLTEVASWFVQARQTKTNSLLPGMSVHQSSLSRRVGRLLDDDLRASSDRKQNIMTLMIVSLLLGALVFTPGVNAVARERENVAASAPPASPVDDFPVPRPVHPAIELPSPPSQSIDRLEALDFELSMLEREVALLKQAIKGTPLELEVRDLIAEFERKAASIQARKMNIQKELDLHSPAGPEPDRSR